MTSEFEIMADDGIERVKLALAAIERGEIVILIDDEDRENEGDLTLAAEKVTPEAINFMATHGRGLICLTLTESRVADLNLPMMAHRNSSPYGTAFTVSIEAREGVTTGISAADRARTVQVAIAPDTREHDLVTPGHIFPLRARDGGVLVRTGQTEGSVDLARLAGLDPSGVICEIMNPDGTMARLPELKAFAREHKLHIVAVADIIRYRLRFEKSVECVIDAPFPGKEDEDCRIKVFRSQPYGSLHVALVVGDLEADGPDPLVRVQVANPAGDLFGRTALLEASLAAIRASGRGAFVYMHVFDGGQDSSRILKQLRARLIPVEVDERPDSDVANRTLREFGIGAQVLLELGIQKMRLMTNHPRKIVGLDAYGIEVAGTVPIDTNARGDAQALAAIQQVVAVAQASE